MAGVAVDGNTDGRLNRGFCTMTLVESDPWWRVDLLSVYNINAITITQSDADENLLIGAEIWIGNSEEPNHNENVRCALVGNLPAKLSFHYSFKAIEGQYITVRLPGNLKSLSFCEIEVFSTEYASLVPNVALKGEASQSSTLPFNDAARAIDGRRNSFYGDMFCSHTAENEVDPWWQVDLQLTYIIRYVKITNRGDCCAERLDGAEIRIGDSPENNGNNNPRC
ncbi:Fucolectin-4 [Liparis tanakae]|uniref:Fucolectin-4 n=1 Tax=Liparis tanakae TaxID=230148 RepID=A0A4Z2I3I2_9TELE|nr:Fucolectin-4 [Liparis tanakae]